MKTRLISRIRRLVRVALMGAVLGATAGCTQVLVTGQTRGEFKLGELQLLVDRDFATVHTAAKNGMKDLGLFEVQDDRLVIEAELKGRDPTDTKVVVKVKEIAKNRTSIKIRYGIPGELAGAQKLYAAIEKRL
jgi:hypothetical protein